MAESGRDRDLVLAPGEFAFVLDTTKGVVNVDVGPYKTSMAGTDQPVVFDKDKLRFIRCDLDAAIQRDTVAPEGFYMALYNPALDDKFDHPRVGVSSNSTELKIGHRVNIPGPAHFSLWPGQMADVIRGHHLRSNQYLLAQVYNDIEASENWKTAVVKTVGDATPAAPRTFTPGQTMVIKGTEVAFFIPPTGIKVVPEAADKFVREAVTLERLEYCILLDENGKKRFVPGPDVVFPEPTETFITKTENGAVIRKFRAIELNETTGIYVKVIADYTDATGDHKAGDELFITGKEQAIYYQREEHSIIRYGDQTKHYAVVVPSGEGRYVLDRRTGVITLAHGPQMLLCDPRHEVIVRRVLSQKAAALYYPNNPRVLQVNAELEAADIPQAASASAYEPGRVMRASASYMALNAIDEVASASRQLAGDTFMRGNKFTPPRTITLDTKYEGAVAVSVWTGYAVLVIKKTGERHVAVGPQTLLLEYDETLAPLSLSTGRPKSGDTRLETVYLRVKNNTVSDIIDVETKDLVRIKLALSYRVNFEGEDAERWFAVENYIGLLTDHMRSLIRNAIKHRGVEEFYANAIDIVRDTVLGPAAPDKARTGRQFAENGMRVYDVEVLNVKIDNPSVENVLNQVQLQALQGAITIAQEERQLQLTLRSEDIKRQTAAAKTVTIEQTSELTGRELAATLAVALTKVMNDAKVASEKLARELATQDTLTTLSAAELGRRKAAQDMVLAEKEAEIALELKRLIGETEEVSKRAQAVSPALAAALTTFSDQNLIEKITVGLAPLAAMNGVSAADVLAGLFKGTPFESVMKQLGTRSRIPVATTVG